MKRLLKVFAAILLALILLLMSAWGLLALHYAAHGPGVLRAALASLLLLSALGSLICLATRRHRSQALAIFALAFAALLGWWSTIEPSNDREWKVPVARLPEVRRNGDLVTIRNVRNFDYVSANEFVPAYYDKTYDVQKLESVDIIASYWSGPAIAHIFISFGFGNDDYLAVSVERRDEEGEGYSTLRGLFRQFEIFYVVADERDVIRLRTNFRKDPPEDVYLYRVQGPLESGRRLFLEYLRRIEGLEQHPDFYNTVTSNCAGNIWINAHVNPGRVAYSWKILMSGHVPEYLYDLGLLDTSQSFGELQTKSRINDAALAAEGTADFSKLIRARLPDPNKP